jgi:type IV secretion system protein TrbI
MSEAAHQSSAPPTPLPDVAIRAKPPSPRRLSRKVLLAGTLGMGAIIAFALASGLSERPDRGRDVETEANASAAGPPESIRLAPPQYGIDDLAGTEAQAEEDILWGDHPPDTVLSPPADAAWRGEAQASSVNAGHAEETIDPETAARLSRILFTEARTDEGERRDAAIAPGRHASFMAGQRGGDERLAAQLTPPRSAYEIMAGAVIPAALATELNSDLPGRVIAQVTAPVFDSVSGQYLLIPQGSRLIGSYDSATAYGDRRLLLVWNRLILPNGWSINLEGMEGADPSGAAGLRDRSDNHLDRLAGAVALSAIISVVANEAEGDDDEQGFGQSVGDAAAQEAAQTGGRIVDRELSVRPTLRVRVGAPVRVLVTRDIRLRPYRR